MAKGNANTHDQLGAVIHAHAALPHEFTIGNKVSDEPDQEDKGKRPFSGRGAEINPARSVPAPPKFRGLNNRKRADRKQQLKG